ncbi:hypothetical protein E2C01_041352 [Portunus trituberculatus]|uniref:Uncharacterized protein n=1 Tax=Portunus trituberculatus TaxID=210409 RepID=A0A5B7FMD6_PORTR|nr:hypothetical protein [Portunus trituberculatus]
MLNTTRCRQETREGKTKLRKERVSDRTVRVNNTTLVAGRWSLEPRWVAYRRAWRLFPRQCFGASCASMPATRVYQDAARAAQ